ncbi:putative metallophosphoesterase [Salvia divinorum]|uniref:Metallophosphoesterase n=1 Tax=Salvia divinorum TaxID=28513 RepID=A0ABD1H6X3_SALDI
MGNATVIIAVFLLLFFAIPSAIASGDGAKRRLIEAEGSPDDLVWVVQLSDLHFSVHHPRRAQDFINFVGPALSFIKPSLVLLTGDLTDGKSKDLLTMKQDEEEWIEYQKVMQNVVDRSGLGQRAFYDIRGNHDNFGVPATGGSLDFFSRYSINAHQQRSGKVNSITIQTSKRKLLFVGIDSTMDSGLRGPTNLFGHPTDELLAEIDAELLQWDSRSAQPVTKVSFGHFTLSFSAASKTGKTLKDIFIDRSLAAYICGHLHIKFGKNLKRHHHSSSRAQRSKQLLQLNGHRLASKNASSTSCRETDASSDGFWEWEMGDWRKSRAMRVLAIDRGHISFVDVNFTLGAKKTIILPTYPLDSRFSSPPNYKCDPSTYGHIRALVFSASPIISVEAKVYDTSSGNLIVVLDTPMKLLAGSGGDLYVVPWHVQAFEDPSPERYVLQIEATDFKGRTTTTELRPFSVTGIPSRFKWSWAEFFVLGCQWDSLYYPILWGIYSFVLSALLIPRALLFFSKRHYTYINFRTNKSFINGLLWISTELYSIPAVSFCMIGYLLYLALCPWLYGQALSQEGKRAFMTYRGWVVSRFSFLEKMDFLGSPDVMVVVLPHLIFVVLPALVTIVVLAAESSVHRDYLLSISSRKKDGSDSRNKKCASQNTSGNKSSEPKRRWIRRLFLVGSLAIFWKHFKNCEVLVKAYEMNPVIHFPLYSLAVPLLLVYSVWRTGRSMNTTST